MEKIKLIRLVKVGEVLGTFDKRTFIRIGTHHSENVAILHH